MNIRLLKTKIKNIDNYENGVLDIDFITEKRVYLYEKENFIVTNLFSSINKMNTIALVGKNATGKTTTLNIVSDILKVFVDNRSISECENIGKHFNKTLNIENLILVDDVLYRIESLITKDGLGNIYFLKEDLYKQSITAKTSKSELDSITKFKKILDRNESENNFLKKDDSIFSSVLNRNEHNTESLVRDMGRFTNFNFLGYFSKHTPLSFVNYLDPSIEEFYISKTDLDSPKNGQPIFCLKFKNKEKVYKMDLMEIENYLSSGTIKGMNILFNAMIVLKNGGYLLIDEIENHLNKSIVINLIGLFTSKINKNGATLIFTTHYSEVLDSIERSDSIYILNKEEKITLNKFSKLANKKDRIDKKKSDLVLSGELDNAPSYFAYQKLKKDMIRSIGGENNDWF